MKLTYLVLSLRMCEAVPPLSQYALWHAQSVLSCTVYCEISVDSLGVQHTLVHRSSNSELQVITFMKDFMHSVECFFFLNQILKLVHGAVPPLPKHLYIKSLIKYHLPYTLLLSAFVGTDLHQQIARCHHA